MRLRSATLGLLLAACYSSPEGADEFGGGGEDPGAEATGSSSGAPGSSEGGAPPTTGAPDETTTGDDPSAPPPASSSSEGGEVSSSTTFEATTTAPDDTGDDTTTTGGPPADCPRVRVTVVPGEVLNVRPTPSTAMEALGTLGSGAIVDVLDLVDGEVIEDNGQWFQISGQDLVGYVWSGFVECTLDEPPTGGFFLPLTCGMQATISQGNFGDFSHQGNSAYAFDFSLAMGTPLVAIADGTVSNLYGETGPGDPCYNGGGQECNYATNYVTLLHGDGTKSVYGHLSAVSVQIGAFVGRGTEIGKVGSTGWSTGPHAHVARQENCGGGWCQSIAVTFADVPGDGVPDTGDVVVSQNCP